MAFEIRTWLADLGMSEHIDAFVDNEVDAALLPELTNEDLKDLGVTKLGHRKALRGYSGHLPADLSPGDTIQLLNIGGVLGVCDSANPDVGPPFDCEVLGTVPERPAHRFAQVVDVGPRVVAQRREVVRLEDVEHRHQRDPAGARGRHRDDVVAAVRALDGRALPCLVQR